MIESDGPISDGLQSSWIENPCKVCKGTGKITIKTIEIFKSCPECNNGHAFNWLEKAIRPMNYHNYYFTENMHTLGTNLREYARDNGFDANITIKPFGQDVPYTSLTNFSDSEDGQETAPKNEKNKTFVFKKNKTLIKFFQWLNFPKQIVLSTNGEIHEYTTKIISIKSLNVFLCDEYMNGSYCGRCTVSPIWNKAKFKYLFKRLFRIKD